MYLQAPASGLRGSSPSAGLMKRPDDAGGGAPPVADNSLTTEGGIDLTTEGGDPITTEG